MWYWPRPGHGGCLGSEAVDGRSPSVGLYRCGFVLQINKMTLCLELYKRLDWEEESAREGALKMKEGSEGLGSAPRAGPPIWPSKCWAFPECQVPC